MIIPTVYLKFYTTYPRTMNKATLSHLAKHLKPTSQILMRADFNVPIKEGKIKDDNRIKSKHQIT